MLRLLLCLSFWVNTASADEYEAARGPAILELEQALWVMALKDGTPDQSWDAESAAGLETLRQRIRGFGGEERYKEIIQFDPMDKIASKAVTLASKTWDFYNGHYRSAGRRGLLAVHDGQLRVFVEPYGQAEAGKEPAGYKRREPSPMSWCREGGTYVRMGIEIPYSADGMVDLRPNPNTALNRLVNTVILPFLAQYCPGSLDGDESRVVADIYIRGETFVGKLLRKPCDNIIRDRPVAIFNVHQARETGGLLVIGTDKSLSGVGFEGAPDGTITRKMVDEEQLFAPRTECREEKHQNVRHMLQFKNRYGY